MALDLTGVYNSNDGGEYYVRQIGNTIFWYGEPADNPGGWSNVAYGHVDPKGVVMLEWADVPKGHNRLGGEVTFQSSPDGKVLTRTAVTGGMANAHMTKIR